MKSCPPIIVGWIFVNNIFYYVSTNTVVTRVTIDLVECSQIFVNTLVRYQENEECEAEADGGVLRRGDCSLELREVEI